MATGNGKPWLSNWPLPAKLLTNVAKEWLSRQALWQFFLAVPKRIPCSKFDVPQPNAVHQADLLLMPHDWLGRKVFKYALAFVDIAIRFKEAEPLLSKNRMKSTQPLSEFTRKAL